MSVIGNQKLTVCHAVSCCQSLLSSMNISELIQLQFNDDEMSYYIHS